MADTTEPQTRLEALEQLVKDYDQYLADIAPFSYKDGAEGKRLRERKAALLEEAGRPDENA